MSQNLPTRTSRLVALLVTLACAPDPRQTARGDEARDFYNVVDPDGADPWVWKHTDGRYYLAVTTGRDVTLRRSRTLSGMGSGRRKVVWTPPPSGPFSKDIWAPELHFLRGKWYVYFAADDGANDRHRVYVLENPAADPFEGAFTFKGRLTGTGDDHWAVDGAVLRVGEQLYFLWSGWEGDEDVRQDLYIAPMRDPWTLGGPRVRIASPALPWETRGAPPAVLEGPQVLVKRGKVHVVYSASGSWTDHYCLGLLTASLDSDLLSPASWSKRGRPIFESGNAVVSPGHCTFTTSPDDTEDWIVYHAARYPGAGWSRQVLAQKFDWSADGSPVFGAPAPPDAPLPLPSGEPRRLRFEAEAAALGGSARPVRRPGASRGAEVGFIATPDSSVAFDLTVSAPGAYALSVRFANNDPGKAEATHALTVNGGPPQVVRYVYTGPGRRSIAGARVTLKAGANRVTFAKGERVAEIDCLDVVSDPEGEPRP